MKAANYLTILICLFTFNSYSQSQDNTSEKIDNNTTSSYLLSRNNIDIFPIPAVDDVTIKFSDESNNYEILKLVDSLGEVKYHKLLNDNKKQIIVGVSDLEPGVYFLHFENSKGDFLSKKIIVK